MNLIISWDLLDDLYVFSSAITLAITLTTLLLLIKFLTIFWLNDVIVFGSGEHHVEVKTPKVIMSTVNIPFTFQLHDKLISNFKGVHCVLSSQVCYRLEAFWGVDIAELHHFLRKPWKHGAETSFLQTSHYQQLTPVIKDKSHENKCIQLSLLDFKSLKLGVAPRQFYPLVVLLVRDTSEEESDPHQTIALINIIHVQDEVCTLSTSLLGQYLKQANGRLTTLKQLYVESANISNNQGDKTDNEAQDQLCIVCQVHPISRALLNCRHTCICAVCFSKLNACPLCRSPIASYFLIRNEDYYVPTEKSHFTTEEGTFSQWFQDRITDLLGFER